MRQATTRNSYDRERPLIPERQHAGSVETQLISAKSDIIMLERYVANQTAKIKELSDENEELKKQLAVHTNFPGLRQELLSTPFRSTTRNAYER